MTEALVFAAGVAVAWLCLRGDTRPVSTVVPARLGWLDPTGPWRTIPDRPWSDWLPDPAVTAELDTWIAATNDMPVDWQHHPDPPRPRPVRHITTDELRELVGG